MRYQKFGEDHPFALPELWKPTKLLVLENDNVIYDINGEVIRDFWNELVAHGSVEEKSWKGNSVHEDQGSFSIHDRIHGGEIRD